MNGAVLLNARGQRESARELTIILPASAREAAFECTICGARFLCHQAQLYERHTAQCAREHIDEIRAMAPSHRKRGTPFDPENWDPEVEAHMRQVGRRMIAEGRLEVRPNERAGLS